MRILLSALLLVFTIATFASAELLVTANPLGQGKWAGLVSGLQNYNAANLGSSTTALMYGGYVGYGINDKTDLYVNLGTGSINSGLPAYLTSYIVSSYGANLLYNIITEGKDSPVSVSVGVGAKALTYNVTTTGIPGAGNAIAGGGQWLAGVGVSKIMAPFVPYGGLIYRNNGGAAGSASQVDLTVGSAIAWSLQGAVFVEATNQMISSGTVNYSSTQLALGVGYKI